MRSEALRDEEPEARPGKRGAVRPVGGGIGARAPSARSPLGPRLASRRFLRRSRGSSPLPCLVSLATGPAGRWGRGASASSSRAEPRRRRARGHQARARRSPRRRRAPPG